VLVVLHWLAASPGSASGISSVKLQGEVNRDGYHEYGYAENRA
jgi:hypothetical protein